MPAVMNLPTLIGKSPILCVVPKRPNGMNVSCCPWTASAPGAERTNALLGKRLSALISATVTGEIAISDPPPNLLMP